MASVCWEKAITTSVNSKPDASDISPLAGRRVLITRAPRQASELADRLRELGAIPIVVPTIEIGPPSSFAALDAALASLPDFDLIAFTSGNAVEAYHARVQLLGITAPPKRIAVVGPATARALEAIGLQVDVMPATYTAEALGAMLAPEASGLRILSLLGPRTTETGATGKETRATEHGEHPTDHTTLELDWSSTCRGHLDAARLARERASPVVRPGRHLGDSVDRPAPEQVGP